MARPRRKRSAIEPSLAAASQLLMRHLVHLSGTARTTKLVEYIEKTAQILISGPAGNDSIEQQQMVDFGHAYAAHQVKRLHALGYNFATRDGLLAFFLCQLFEKVRHQPDQVRGFKKRKDAAYYTPAALSYYMVRSVFAGQALDFVRLRVLDFCAGSGALLIAALEYLAQPKLAQQDSTFTRLQLLKAHIFAIEIDPLTLRTCKAALAIACGVETQLLPPSNFLQADGLIAAIEPCQFVLMNPPWSESAYKLFVQRACELLAESGHAAVLTPAGFYCDQGAEPLRRLLLERYCWQSLEGFVNADTAFAVHPEYEYALSIFSKCAPADFLKARFALKADDQLIGDGQWLQYQKSQIERLSPDVLAVLPCQTQRQLELFAAGASKNARLYQLHADGLPQMERGKHMQRQVENEPSKWSFRFARDFDMTIDRERFITVESALAAGFCSDGSGRYFKGSGDDQEILLPLIEGRMLGQYTVTAKYWISGGRQSLWRDADKVEEKAVIGARYLVTAEEFDCPRSRIGFVSVTSASNSRSMIAAVLPAYPAGNSVPIMVFTGEKSEYYALILTAILNSLCFDYFLRTRLSGNNLNYFLLDQCFVPDVLMRSRFEVLPQEARQSLDLLYEIASQVSGSDDASSRQKRPLLEAVITRLYGLSAADFAEILQGCLTEGEPVHARGFHRIDKELPLAERLPYLAYQALIAMESTVA